MSSKKPNASESLVRAFQSALSKSGILKNPKVVKEMKKAKKRLERSPSTSPYVTIAEQFATHLMKGNFKAAHKMLSAKLRRECPAGDLKKRVASMIKYAKAPITNVQVVNTSEDLPNSEPNDVGWAYVSMDGDGFCEAVSVTVTKENDELFIRTVDFGRP